MFFSHKKEIKQDNPTSAVSSNSQEKEMPLVVHTMPELFVKKIFNPFTSKFWFLSIGSIVLISLIGYTAIYLIPSLGKKKIKKELISEATTTIPVQPSASQPLINQPIVIEPTSTVPLINTATSSIDIDTPTSTPVDIVNIDTDQDGLSDLEEKLYGGNSNISDTDGDGYNDKTEIENLYSITSGPNILLIDSNTVKIYNNSIYRYSIYYPSGWTQSVVSGVDNEVRFISETGEFVEVLVQDNPKKLSINEWYKEQIGENNITLKSVEVNGFMGIVTEDGLITYLSSSKDLSKIYGLIYNIGNKTEPAFSTTYKMMLNSFKLMNNN